MDRVAIDLPQGRTVAWRVFGPAPPVVCVPGAGVSSRVMLPLLNALAGVREGWSVDLPGFGASRYKGRALGVGELSDALVSWLREAVPVPIVLVGSSFGCQLSVRAALRARSQVAGLLLIGPTTDQAARAWIPQVGRWLRNAVHEPAGLGPISVRDYADAGPKRVVRTVSESFRDRLEDRLPHIPVPVTVVRGARDALVPQAWAEEVTRLLPRGRLCVVEGSAHTVQLGRPRRCAELIDGLVNEVLA